jgi:hypothetical protein
MSKYNLSIIVTSRNDNHGGNLNKRNQIFIDHLSFQTQKFKIPIELIIVEWNPPSDKPPLKDAFTYNYLTDYLSIKYVTVPSKIHFDLYSGKNNLPLYQMIAKNVGARYAQSDFFLFTNIDILFPDEFYIFLKYNQLDENSIYRVDRIDISDNIYDINNPEYFLDFAKKNSLYINKINGTFRIDEEPYSNIDIKLKFKYFYNIDTPLHTNTCGDFQLISKNNFFNLRGYWEFDGYSIHIDSVFQLQAYFSNIVQVILPFPIYHINHEKGWSSNKLNNLLLYKNFLSKNISLLNYSDLYNISNSLSAFNTPLTLNSQNWGLIDHKLDVFEINSNRYLDIIPDNTQSYLSNYFEIAYNLINDSNFLYNYFKYTPYKNNLSKKNYENKNIVIFGNYDSKLLFFIKVKNPNANIYVFDQNLDNNSFIFNSFPIFNKIFFINSEIKEIRNFYYPIIQNAETIYLNKKNIINENFAELFEIYILPLVQKNTKIIVPNVKSYKKPSKNNYLIETSQIYQYVHIYEHFFDNNYIYSTINISNILEFTNNYTIDQQNYLQISITNNKIQDFVITNKYVNNPFKLLFPNFELNPNNYFENSLVFLLGNYIQHRKIVYDIISFLVKEIILQNNKPLKNLFLILSFMLYDNQSYDNAIKFANYELNYYPDNQYAKDFLLFLHKHLSEL